MKGNSKHISGNSLSPLMAQNKDIGAASRTLLGRLNYVCKEAYDAEAASGVIYFSSFLFRPLFNSDNELDNSEATAIYKQV